jgi:hypothetical protein
MTARTRTTALAALLGTLATIALAIPPADAADSPAKPDLVGEWQGTLAVGDARLRLVVHLQESDDGTLGATLDSPDQGATGIPVERVTSARRRVGEHAREAALWTAPATLAQSVARAALQ